MQRRVGSLVVLASLIATKKGRESEPEAHQPERGWSAIGEAHMKTHGTAVVQERVGDRPLASSWPRRVLYVVPIGCGIRCSNLLWMLFLRAKPNRANHRSTSPCPRQNLRVGSTCWAESLVVGPVCSVDICAPGVAYCGGVGVFWVHFEKFDGAY